MRQRPARPRLPDWPERLAEIVDAKRDTPFAWGRQDCVTVAADVVLAITGSDPITAYRGRYATEAEAEALLSGGLEEAAARLLADFGAVECPPAFAQRGDVVLVVPGNQPTMGVVIGDRVMAPGPDGLFPVPLRLAKRAWAI